MGMLVPNAAMHCRALSEQRRCLRFVEAMSWLAALNLSANQACLIDDAVHD